MANIWKQNQDVNEHPNRNNFDLSYSNHLTMKFGALYPIMCKEVVPGDSFEINAMFGLKFMPFNFPVQSRMRAHIHYFYVPNRILWKNWKNFISGLEQHEHPYIDQPSSFFKTGSLADYLDIPTTLAGSRNTFARLSSKEDGYGVYRHIVVNPDGTVHVDTSNPAQIDVTGSFLYSFKIGDNLADGNRWRDVVDIPGDPLNRMFFYETKFNPRHDIDSELEAEDLIHFCMNLPYLSAGGRTLPAKLVLWKCPKGSIEHDGDYTNFRDYNPYQGQYVDENGISWDVDYIPEYSQNLVIDRGVPGALELSTYHSGCYAFRPTDTSQYRSFMNDDYDDAYDYYLSLVISAADSSDASFVAPHDTPTTKIVSYPTGVFYVPVRLNEVTDTSEIVTPFGNDAIPFAQVRVNALPFRAYESIYWSYFANTQNQPFYIDGVQQFNKYNTTDEDGADSTPYHLFYRNYELDYLTSGMPSPQFGVAPLVGMSALGDITIEDENGISTFHATTDDDGNISMVTATSPVASIEHARTAMNMASVGMNINDFRNVNAYQRFLETTLRKGYKYKDFIMGHHGVNVSGIELDMPEFIGGVSQDVNVQAITNMTAGTGVPLGQFAGVANCFGGTNNTIRKYCDDYGYIIGVMSVVPTPAYSQLLPKHWLHDSQLSYYFNEFSQLGLQPITYKEVCPVQSYQEYNDVTRMEDTFCYQRPNYDLIGNVDQVHGDFRLSRRSALVNRIFEHRPELGTDFLTINPSEVNDIFAYTDADRDTIIGQIVLDIKAKRPVPRVNIPSLGR